MLRVDGGTDRGYTPEDNKESREKKEDIPNFKPHPLKFSFFFLN